MQNYLLLKTKKYIKEAEEITETGKKLLIVNDFDETISQDGPSLGEDPRDTIIEPDCAKSLKSLSESGQFVAIISNRSGVQIAKRLYDSGIDKAYVVGTYGWEIFLMNKNLSYFGQSIIDDKFAKHSSAITTILESLSNRLLNYLHQPKITDLSGEVLIDTLGGPIILERKGINPDFPQGLSHVYNLNLLKGTLREEIIRLLKVSYKESLNFVNDIKSSWGKTEDIDPTHPHRYSLTFGPAIKEGKAFGLNNIIEQLKKDNLLGTVGMIIYAGDSNADAEAMIKAKEIADKSNGKIHNLGIYVKSLNFQNQVAQTAEIQVEGVKGYSQFLNSLVNIQQDQTYGI